MIVVPHGSEEVSWCFEFYKSKLLSVTADAHWLIWATEGVPQWVIAYDAWMGSTCQLYMAARRTSAPPRSLIRATFQHGFSVLKRTHIFAFVDSNDTSVMRLDLWLGFKEIYRVPAVFDAGGDLVALQMMPGDCRWLEKTNG